MVLRGPINRGKTFLRADALLKEGESVTHWFDCNTVGPVPVALGYGSRTLTHSAAYVLEGSKHNTSSLSSKHEKIHIQSSDNDLRELSETKVGVQRLQTQSIRCQKPPILLIFFDKNNTD